jgi:hypothetical protein
MYTGGGQTYTGGGQTFTGAQYQACAALVPQNNAAVAATARRSGLVFIGFSFLFGCLSFPASRVVRLCLMLLRIGMTAPQAEIRVFKKLFRSFHHVPGSQNWTLRARTILLSVISMVCSR